MSVSPKVSFIIAAYNEEEYIEECIDSCLNQSYSNIEVCVVDDGSEDLTSELINKIMSRDSRIKFQKFDINKGKVAAFNAAYDMADGDYFAILGADDTSVANRIDASLKCIRDSGANLVYGDYYICDERMNIKSTYFTSSDINIDNILFNNKIPGGTVFFDKMLANNIFPIPQNLKFEDWWISFVAILVGGVCHMHVPVINYRFHAFNDSVTQAVFGVKRKDFLRHERYYEEFEKYLTDNNRQSLIGKLREASFLKRMYLTEKISPRFGLAYNFLMRNGIPRGAYGWVSLIFIAPFGGGVFDIAYFVKMKLAKFFRR